MPQQQIQNESFKSSPSALVELWTVDGTNIGLSTIYYFCNMNSNSFKPIVFNGISYTPFPIRVEGMALDGKGSIPRPKLTVSNINGFVSALLLQNQQLNGAVITRQRVYARFLDAVNFETPTPIWVTPDPAGAYPPEPWVVNRKVVENNQVVQFELTSPISLEGVHLPRRQIIANVCTWKYRGPGCQYNGAPVADNANRLFTGPYYNMTLVDKGAYNAGTTYARGEYVTSPSNLPQLSNVPVVYVCLANGTVGVTPSTNPGSWVPDACSKTVAGCTLRFPNQPLRTSAYPGVTRSNWISSA